MLMTTTTISRASSKAWARWRRSLPALLSFAFPVTASAQDALPQPAQPTVQAPVPAQQPSWYPPYQGYPPPPASASENNSVAPSPGAPPVYPVAGYAPLDDRPNVLDYDASKPIPTGYTVEKRLRKGLLIGGGVTLGLGYAFSVLVAGVAGQDQQGGNDSHFNSTLLYLPVLGPWLAIPTAHSNCKDDWCKNDRKNAITGLVLLGGTQAVGAVLVAIGFVPSKRLVRSDLSVEPVFIGQNGYGVALSGAL